MKKIIILPLISLFIIIDQTLKCIFLRFWPSLVVENKGIAFGLFPGDFWIFTSLLLIVIIFYILLKHKDENQIKILSLLIIVAGGSSNLIDRIRWGAVVDFIKIPLWPTTFNMADVAIVLGVFLFLWSQKLFIKTSK